MEIYTSSPRQGFGNCLGGNTPGIQFEENAMNDFGLTHFFHQLDLIGRFVLFALLCMSLASWSAILLKLAQFLTAARQRNLFLKTYHSTATPAHLQIDLEHTRNAGYTRITCTGFQALSRWTGRIEHGPLDATDGLDFVSTRLALAVARERERLENGLTILAAVGSTAPFVGLFGTVWGIYHALIVIGATGQGTLDKVAGPVGEALIMTAIGLSVAIPAVLAYNAYVRTLQRTTIDLEDFANELLSFITTGIHAPNRLQPPHIIHKSVLAENH
jgi:biopolymer transport protein ExbB